MSIETDLIVSLLITIATEYLVYILILRKEPLKLAVYSTLVNSSTLPLATYGYWYVLGNLLIIEIIVVLAETPLLKNLIELKYRKALLLSILANLPTAVMSFAQRYLNII